MKSTVVGFVSAEKVENVLASRSNKLLSKIRRLKKIGYDHFLHLDSSVTDKTATELAIEEGFKQIIFPEMKALVDSCDLLLVFPSNPQSEGEDNGWEAVLYARSIQRRVLVI